MPSLSNQIRETITTVVCSSLRQRMALLRPTLQHGLQSAFRRDLSLFCWGQDHLELVLEKLGLQYRENPPRRALTGAVVLMDGSLQVTDWPAAEAMRRYLDGRLEITEWPAVEAVRHYVERGGVFVTTGDTLVLMAAAFPDQISYSDPKVDGLSPPKQLEVKSPSLAWALPPDGRGVWLLGRDTLLPRLRSSKRPTVALESRGYPLVVRLSAGDGQAIHLTGNLLPSSQRPAHGRTTVVADFLRDRLGLNLESARSILGDHQNTTLDETLLLGTTTMTAVLIDLLGQGLQAADHRRCRIAVARHTSRDPSTLRVLWHRSGGGDVVHFVGRFVPGPYCVLTRLAGQWSFVEGDRDSVLATVPDNLFEEACHAVLECDLESAGEP